MHQYDRAVSTASLWPFPVWQQVLLVTWKKCDVCQSIMLAVTSKTHQTVSNLCLNKLLIYHISSNEHLSSAKRGLICGHTWRSRAAANARLGTENLWKIVKLSGMLELGKYRTICYTHQALLHATTSNATPATKTNEFLFQNCKLCYILNETTQVEIWWSE